MSRGRIPSLLSLNCGRPNKVIVKRKSSCRRCKKELNCGDFCIDIPRRNGYTSSHRYCFDCFKEIINKTKIELNKIEVETFSEN